MIPKHCCDRGCESNLNWLPCRTSCLARNRKASIFDESGDFQRILVGCGEREEEVTYRLVTPEEIDPTAGLISTVSPIGRSLMGKEEGDEVTVTTPAGSRTFEIKSLKTLHDENKTE